MTGSMNNMRLLRGCAISALAVAFLAGCGSDMPFELLPVHGKVTFDDGSTIKAEQIVVAFAPAGTTTGPITAPRGTAQVNVGDGTFAAATTRRRDDGVVAGRHKVVVASFKKGPHGSPVPSDVIPTKYKNESTTPLEVEIDTADQFIEIKVTKK